jgi:hypothetical protein
MAPGPPISGERRRAEIEGTVIVGDQHDVVLIVPIQLNHVLQLRNRFKRHPTRAREDLGIMRDDRVRMLDAIERNSLDTVEQRPGTGHEQVVPGTFAVHNHIERSVSLNLASEAEVT